MSAETVENARSLHIVLAIEWGYLSCEAYDDTQYLNYHNPS